jgi:hypothetical protein
MFLKDRGMRMVCDSQPSNKRHKKSLIFVWILRECSKGKNSGQYFLSAYNILGILQSAFM